MLRNTVFVKQLEDFDRSTLTKQNDLTSLTKTGLPEAVAVTAAAATTTTTATTTAN